MEETITNLFRNRPQVIAGLKRRYAEEHRHYHTWDHINAMMGWADRVRDQIQEFDSIALATLYHDAIYDPKASDNEPRSAELFLLENKSHFEPEIVSRVDSLIRATQTHQLPEVSKTDTLEDHRLFLDIDLSILGARPEVFDIYEENIAREYAFVPEDVYRVGRSRVLQGFLDRDTLFFSNFFKSELEATAVTNLKRSLERLSEPSH